MNFSNRAKIKIIGHQNIKSRIQRGLVTNIRNIKPFIAAPTARRFKKISNRTRLTAANKLMALTKFGELSLGLLYCR